MRSTILIVGTVAAFAGAVPAATPASQAAGRPCEPLHVAGGGAGYCVIRVDGRVACWGDEIHFTPYSPAPGGRFRQVSVGSYAACGVREDGQGVCWGKGFPQEVPEIDGEFLQLSAGLYGVVAILPDGTLDYIPIGDNSDQEVPEGTFVEISAGCARRSDHTLECLYPTTPPPGKFERVAGPCAIAQGGKLECWGGWEEIVQAPATELYRDLSSSSGFSSIRSGEGICAVAQGGAAMCWGEVVFTDTAPDEQFREVAFGYGWPWGLTTDGRLVPWAPWPDLGSGNSAPLVGSFVQIAAGGDGSRPLSCGVEASGRVQCWGNDQFGQASPPGGDFLEVGTGNYHACGLRTDGSIECWGNDDALLDLEAPAGEFSQIAIGHWGPNCALGAGGTVACWGYGEEVLDVPEGEFASVSAGGQRACALDDDGNATCWRYVYGDTQDEIVLELLPVPDGSFAEISLFFDWYPSGDLAHLCGRRTGGEVECWTDEEGVEAWTAPQGTFAKLSGGGAFACGLRSGGQVECWGPDWIRNLAAPEGEFVQVVPGAGHVCGLALDGTVVCTGSDQTVSVCGPSLLCGNGELDDSESCDDGDQAFAPGDACTGGCWSVPCGQPIHPESEGPLASDALFALRAAVGSSSCSPGVCDTDANAAVTVIDALAILKKSVGAGPPLSCS